MHKIFIITLIALSVTSCSSMLGYIAPTTGDLSKIEIKNHLTHQYLAQLQL